MVYTILVFVEIDSLTEDGARGLLYDILDRYNLNEYLIRDVFQEPLENVKDTYRHS